MNIQAQLERELKQLGPGGAASVAVAEGPRNLTFDVIERNSLAVVLNQLDDLDVPWDVTVVSYRQTDGGLGHAAEITTYRSANQEQGKRAVLAWLKETGLEYRLLTDT